MAGVISVASAPIAKIKSHIAHIQKLMAAGKFSSDGFALYRHHVFVSLLGHQTSLGANTVSPEYAEIRASLDWTFLTEDQLEFWRRKSRELDDGDTKSLGPKVLDDFVAGLLHPEHPAAGVVELPEQEQDLEVGAVEIGMEKQKVKSESESLQAEGDGHGSQSSPHTTTDTQGWNYVMSNFERLISSVQAAQSERHRLRLLHQMNRMVDADGYFLFQFHANAFLKETGAGIYSTGNANLDLRVVWKDSAQQLREAWSSDSGSLKTGLSRGLMDALNHFEVAQISGRSRRYRERVLLAFRSPDGEQQRIEDDIDMITTLEQLIVGFPDPMEVNQTIDKTLQAIALRLREYPTAITLIRWKCMRINYNPGAGGVTGIASRLRAAVDRDICPSNAPSAHQDYSGRMNELIEPFVYLNRKSKAFSDLGIDSTLGAEVSTNHQSSLAWLHGSHCHLKPLTTEKKERIVTFFLQQLRWRVRAQKRDHSLLSPRSASIWSLCKNNKGLHEQLYECFNQEGLSSDEYEDLLEQKMYFFFRAAGDLKGPNDAGGH
ncbi:Hypothetical predicted protein [Lecanosticta acicola]|uniref:Uncharacterized protein n=1 Tax=Lecanosticta acicola TaxID=111012 RepID=A0AAI8YT57_9PEZI|nr:Hypothetical predicted protein [Lecanosticta acicola]